MYAGIAGTDEHSRMMYPNSDNSSVKHKKVSALDCKFLARRPCVSNTALAERRRSYQYPLLGLLQVMQAT